MTTGALPLSQVIASKEYAVLFNYLNCRSGLSWQRVIIFQNPIAQNKNAGLMVREYARPVRLF